ncbi:MAG: WG repeat-containing protein [Candidatus Gastranaerophilales bacterium]|nr:WG repeat-containing protein [Candidatus Gastranaerophilales bacterium]
MKKLLFISILLIFSCAFAQNTQVYSEKNKFGLVSDNEKITPAKYSKLIKLRDYSYLFCLKGKYGIIDNNGEILVEPKYNQAQRYIGKYAKLGRGGKYAIFDEYGDLIVDREYSSIDILYGRMFLVQKNYKYGLISFDGDIILAPIAQDIYMPEKNIIKIKYEGIWYTIEQKEGEMELPDDILAIDNDNFKITQIIENPITSAGYGVVSASDYAIKLFSSISPAYEKTIDELIFDYGADTVGILMKSSWLLKFPVVYTKNYFNILKASDNGPLSDVKTNLKNKITK